MKEIILTVVIVATYFDLTAQNDLVVGSNYQLNIQRKNNHADAFILHNAEYSQAYDLLKWKTSHSTFGSRGIRFSYSTNRGIYFYADDVATIAGSEFTPTTRLFIGNHGRVGIGTEQPLEKLDVRGDLLIESGNNATIFTGTGTNELNRYLALINSPNKTSASGLKSGGILVSDVYSYANPGKNDLIVKGKIGVGTPSPEHGLHVKGNMVLEASSNPIIYTGIGSNELNRYVSLVNSTGHGSASGLKAGGILISDSYNYANPGKNDLIVKGKVGIGTTSTGTHKLAVEGTIGAREIKVEATSWSDFVFEKDYELRTLEEVENFINENKHLPEIPSEKEVEESGIFLGEMDAKLLQKIEELTLHLIEQNKEIKKMKKEISALKTDKDHNRR